MKYSIVVAIFVISLIFQACKDNNPTVNLGNEGSAKIFSQKNALDEIVKKAEQIEGLRSLLISKEGELLSESYFKTYTNDSLDHVRSVTKSVMGLLVGIAIDQKKIKSIHDPISIYLRGEDGLEHRHKDISIYHLLTMSGGFKWDESTVATFNSWVTSSNPVAYVLKQPIVNSPGSTFVYNSASAHLLSVIITKSSGMSTLDFAQRYLFKPLHIHKVRWSSIGGYTNGGAGLQLKPKDMLRLGELMTNGGRVDGNKIISKDWINNAIKSQITTTDAPGYGYLWWTEQEAPFTNGVAQGYGGQFIVVFPDLGAVIIATSNWRGRDAKNGASRTNQFFKLLKSDIYPYVKKD